MNNRISRKLLRTYYQWKARSVGPVFIHVPKTGGTSLGQLESLAAPALWPVLHLGHVAVRSKESHNCSYPPTGFSKRRTVPADVLSQRLVFSFCRNIFDWLVSYAAHAGGWNPRYRDTNHHDYRNVKAGFDYLLKTIANREAPWPCRKMIHFPIFSEDGELIVNWLCRTERLDEDLGELARYAGCTYTPCRRQRVGRHEDYRNYYTDDLIDLVSETWGLELQLFGYDFDGPRDDIAILPRQIHEELRASIRYHWETNHASIPGQQRWLRTA